MNFNYNFGFAQKGLSQEAFDMMDVNKDGKISKEEENLFDQTMKVKYNVTDEEVLQDMLNNGVIEVNETKAGYSLGAEWITDETEREAYLFNIEREKNNKFSGLMSAAYQRTHDGELTAEDNNFLLEIEEMNAIANEFLNANSQYVVSSGGGILTIISDLFDSFTNKNKTRTKDIEKMSDEFKAELQKLTGKNMANKAINDLTKHGDLADWALVATVRNANRDGAVTDEEAEAIQENQVDALMARALQGDNVEGILKGLLESTTDANVKKELIEMAKELSELAGQRYLSKPEEFFNKLNTLATNMVDKLAGKELADAVADNEAQVNQNELPWSLLDKDGFGVDRRTCELAFEEKDERCLKALANDFVKNFKAQFNLTLDETVVLDVLRAMPKSEDYAADGYVVDGKLNLSVFVSQFNSTLNNLDTMAINSQQIDFAADESLQIKTNTTSKDTSDFYTQKVNTNTAKATINGIKGQIKSMAENAYLLKGLEFNQELFDKCFDSASSSVLTELENGNQVTLNKILNNFINAFNSEWVGQSLADITEKQK